MMRAAARARRDVDKVESTGRHLGRAWLENVFFVLVMLLAFGFALILLGEVRRSWTVVLFLVLFWAVMAYLALPRLHRVLTSIYVPDYFIGRTRTTDGLLGDPINLAVTGTEKQLHTALTEAGWIRAEPVTLGSSWRICVAAVFRRSYPRAPVSPLMLFGRTQAFAYQQEVEGSPSKRHHIRFWPTPAGWLLPGGYRVDWLASGTFDRAVGLSFFTGQFTHRIDRDIDIERDYIVESVLTHVPGSNVHVIEGFSTGYHSRNGGGDAVMTDGNLPVLQLGDVDVPAVAAWAAAPEATGRPARSRARTSALRRVGRRPLSIVAALVLTVLSGALTVGDLLIRRGRGGAAVGPDYLADIPTTIQPHTLVALLCITYLPILWLAWRTYRGGRVARLVTVALVTLTQFVQMGQYLNGGRATVSALLTMCTDLLLVYALTSLSAREWTASRDGTSAPTAPMPVDRQ